MALTTIDDRGLKTPIDLLDNEKIRLGTGNDLEIYHTGSQSRIENSGTGELRIQADDIQITDKEANDFHIKCVHDGAVELYHDNVKKLETYTDGIKVNNRIVGDGGDLRLSSGAANGDIQFQINGSTVMTIQDTSKLEVNDNFEICFGNGSDLKIYHDGSHSYIKDTGTGGLWVYSNEFNVASANGAENIIQGTENGAVSLYYDNAKTFQTKAHGIQITGGEGASADILFHADEGDDDADKWYQYAATNGEMVFRNYASGAWEDSLKLVANGAVELYYDNVKKFETYTSGVTVTGELVINAGSLVNNSGGHVQIGHDSGRLKLGAGEDLQIWHDGSNSYLKTTTGHMFHDSQYNQYFRNQDGSETRAVFAADGAVSLYYNSVKKFETTDYGCQAYTIKPYDDDAHDLGESGIRWDDVYATNGTIQTSDRNAKKDIVKSDLGLTFINAVEPVSYKFKTGTRTHYGIIAQDLETVLDGKDFAGLTKDTETGNYGLRYTELISPLIKAVQELSAEVNTLKTEIAALKAA